MTKQKNADPIKEYRLKNGEKKYKFNIYLGINEVTGKEDRAHKSGFNSRKEADIEIARLKVQYDEKPTSIKKQAKRMKFEEVYDLWFMQYRHTVRESTYGIEKPRADNHILPKFKGMYINKITLSFCQEVVNDWYKNYKKANLLISIFNRILAFAKTKNYCDENPMLDVIRPKNQETEEYEAPFYEKDELNHFLSIVEEYENLQCTTAFRLFSYTGLRKGELHGLQWKDIDFQRETLSVKRVLTRGENNKYSFQLPKTKSSIRTISLDGQTMNLLNQYKNYQKEQMFKFGTNTSNPEQLLFTDSTNSFLLLEYFNRKLTKIIKKNKLPYMTIHGFRHTHCSLLFDAGVSIKEVQDRLGHSSADTTMNIYNHVMKNKKQETGNKFAQYMQV